MIETLRPRGIGVQMNFKQSDEVLLNIIDLIQEHIYWKDLSGKYLGCNQKQAESLELSSKHEIIGKTDYDLSPKNIADALVAIDRKVMDNLVEVTVEEEIYKCGKLIVVLSRKIPLVLNERLVGILGMSLDITDRKKLENEVQESKAREERLKALSSMGGMIAHELRTPLTGISFGMHTVEKRVSQLVEIYQKWSTKLNQIPIKQRNIDQLKNVCKDMQLSLQQIDNTIDTVLAGFRPSQVSEERLQSISVDKLFNDLLEQYPLSESELNHISVEYNPKLVVRGIEHVLLHVLSNLIKNAFYFIQEMNKGEITLWATQDKDYVNIHVKDTAKGIDKDQIDKIFEPFFTTKDAAASIGMGLYFCKLAIEALNGEIYCESVKGEKTVFTLTLPIGYNTKHK